MFKLVVFNTQPNIINERLVHTLGSCIENLYLNRIVSCNSELNKILKLDNIDVVVIDSETFGESERSAFRLIKNKQPSFKVFTIANEWKEAEVIDLLQNGVDAILYKKCSEREYQKAVDALLNNEKYLCEKITNLLIHKAINQSLPHISTNFELKEKLTEREIEITSYITKGLATKDIADKLCVSSHTVATHRKNIFRKLKVHNVPELIRKYQAESN
jgi:two-component system response regulator NreC